MRQSITRRQAMAGGLGAVLVGPVGTTAAADKQPKRHEKNDRAADAETELVHRIENLEVEVIGSRSVRYLLKVTGSVLQKGYKNPVLVLKSPTPDAQGNLTYYFAADPPVGVRAVAAVSINARRFLPDLEGKGVKRITVVAETNDMQGIV